jgi:ribonuclease BN (tRNA processing enzyme)
MTSSVRFVGSGDSFGSGGRFQTCILVDAGGKRFAMDFGASTLVALAQQGIEHNSIDAILLTHLHADHCAGVPFMLMDAMLGAKRSRPLYIAGPRDLEYRMFLIQEVLFPGMHVMKPKFELHWIELEPGTVTDVGGLKVTARRVRHTRQTNPTALRVEAGDKIVAYTGDGEFGEEMAKATRGADLLAAECYFYEKPIRWHLNYPDVVRHMQDFGAKRVILTHMSKEMLAMADEVPEECAYDGMVVEI